MQNDNQAPPKRNIKSFEADAATLKFVGKFQKKTGLDFSNSVRLMLRKYAESQGWTR